MSFWCSISLSFCTPQLRLQKLILSLFSSVSGLFLNPSSDLNFNHCIFFFSRVLFGSFSYCLFLSYDFSLGIFLTYLWPSLLRLPSSSSQDANYLLVLLAFSYCGSYFFLLLLIAFCKLISSWFYSPWVFWVPWAREAFTLNSVKCHHYNCWFQWFRNNFNTNSLAWDLVVHNHLRIAKSRHTHDRMQAGLSIFCGWQIPFPIMILTFLALSTDGRLFS